MTIDNKYNIGDRVYLVTDKEQHPFMVIEIFVSATAIAYKVVSGTYDYVAHEIELSKERDTLLMVK